MPLSWKKHSGMMKTLFERSESCAEEAEEIMLDILTHNPDIRSLRNVILIKDIQHKIAKLTQRYTRIYGDLGNKIKEGNDETN